MVRLRWSVAVLSVACGVSTEPPQKPALEVPVATRVDGGLVGFEAAFGPDGRQLILDSFEWSIGGVGTTFVRAARDERGWRVHETFTLPTDGTIGLGLTHDLELFVASYSAAHFYGPDRQPTSSQLPGVLATCSDDGMRVTMESGVYYRDPTEWVKELSLPHVGHAFAKDGATVAAWMRPDGGDPDPALVQVFRRRGTTWVTEAVLRLPILRPSLTLSRDGHVLLAQSHGSIIVYRYEAGTWRVVLEPRRYDTALLSADGKRLALSSASTSGTELRDVSTFELVGTRRGKAVAISPEGDTLVTDVKGVLTVW